MSPDLEAEIDRLLTDGLDQYGAGEEILALESWRKVLELDPGNEHAKDFIATATRPGGADVQADNSVQLVMTESRRLMAKGDLESAYELLRGGIGDEGFCLELETLVELVRVRLLDFYQEQLGDLGAIPQPPPDPSTLTGYNLPKDAGFLLSLLDGSTSIRDLVTISGMDAFDALRTLVGLVRAGLVEVRR